METKPARDVEKDYPKAARAIYNIEHERGDAEEEIEFQLRWRHE